MLEKAIRIICEYQGIPASDISIDSRLVNDLSLSSYDVVGLIGKFEEEFGIEVPDRQIRYMVTVGDIVTFIERCL